MRFRLKTLLVLMALVAVLLRMVLVTLAPLRQEHDAFSALSGRILYVGIAYDGPQWGVGALSKSWLFQRIGHVELRLESTDTDRVEIINKLSHLPHLKQVELVAGDPFPATQAILEAALDEIKTRCPAVNVTILP